MRIGYFFTRGHRVPFNPRNFHGDAPVRRVTPPQHCTAHYPRTRSRLISPLNAGLSGCDPRRPSHSSSSSDTKHPPSLDAAADANDSVHPPPSSRHSLSTVLSCVESGHVTRERGGERGGRELIESEMQIMSAQSGSTPVAKIRAQRDGVFIYTSALG